MEVKVCGITNVEDALLAQECGAQYIGLIFVESSPRAVSIPMARQIKHAVTKKVQVVGVFADQEISAVNELCRDLDLDYVQLHGHEPSEYCKMIERPRIKALTLHDKSNSRQDALDLIIQEYASQVDYLLFDKPKNAVDDGWLDAAIHKLSQIECLRPYFFAGGLNAGNVEKVLSQLSPKALDVASGLESKPGKKDERLVTAFMQVVSGWGSLKEKETI